MAENVVFKFVADGLRQFQTKITGSFSKITRAITSVRGALAGLGAGLALREITRSIAEFEDTMAEVKAISEATGEQFVALRDQAIDLAKNSRFASKEVASAQAELARGGLAVNAILAATPATLALAAAGQLALKEASEIAVTALNQFNLEAEETGRVADVLAAGANKTTAEVASLARGLGQVGPVANALGLDLEQTVALLGALSDGGLKGQKAGTGLRSVLGALSATSAQGSAILSKYNLTLEDLSLKTNSVETVLDRLAPVVANVNDAFVLVGNEGVAALSVLVNSRDGLANLDASLRDVEGSAKRVADVFEDSLGGAIRSFRSQIDGITQEQGQAGLSQILRGFVDSGSDLVGFLDGAAKGLALLARIQADASSATDHHSESASRLANEQARLGLIYKQLLIGIGDLDGGVRAAQSALQTYSKETGTTAKQVADLELFVATLRSEFELTGKTAPPSIGLIEAGVKNLAATKGGAASIAKELDDVAVAAKAAAVEGEILSESARLLFGALGAQTAEIQGRGAAVVEVFEKLGDTIRSQPGFGGLLLKEAEDVLNASKKVGIALPADFQRALAALREFSESGSSLLANLREEEKSLSDQSRDLASGIEEAAKSGERSTFVLAGLGDAAESLAKKYEAAGLSIPTSIQKVIDRLGDLNEVSEDVIGKALERQESLTERMTDLGETVDAVLFRDRSDSDPFLLAAAREQVAAIDQELAALGIKAPESFEAIKKKVNEFALGVEAATGKMRGLKEATQDLSGLREEYEKLLAQFNQGGLSPDDLNRFNELEFQVGGVNFSTDAERDLGTIRDQIEDGLTGGVGLQLSGADALAAARDALQQKGRLTGEEQKQLDALDKAAAAAGESVSNLTDEQVGFQEQQGLTNELIQAGNETVQELGDAVVKVGDQYGAAAQGAEDFENTIRRGNVATGEAATKAEESAEILRRLQDQRRGDTTAVEGQTRATEGYAKATQEGADATEAHGKASDGLTQSLEDQEGAARKAGEAGAEAGERGAQGQRTAEEAARDHLEVVEELETALKRIKTLAPEVYGILRSETEASIPPCEALRDCVDAVGS